MSALGTQGTTYYISAVIGRDGDGNGQIDDLGGFCTVVTPGLPVSYSELVLSVDYICQDLLADFTISASGGSGSYAISGNLYSGPFTAGQAPILVLDKDDATYNVTATDGNGCTDTYSVLTTCKTVPIEWLTFTGDEINTGFQINDPAFVNRCDEGKLINASGNNVPSRMPLRSDGRSNVNPRHDSSTKN